MSVKYSIILPFFEKLKQFQLTLVSYRQQYAERHDFEVIVVEDNKNVDGLKHWIREHVSELPEHFTYLQEPQRRDGSRWWSCGHLWNIAAEEAKGQILVITEPEVFHSTDLLSGFDSEFSDGKHPFVCCSCKNGTNIRMAENGELQYEAHSWRQHSIHNNKLLCFCVAMKKFDFLKMGGFDAAFSPGYCYQDDDFRDRILESGLDVVTRDDLETVHLQHDHTRKFINGSRLKALHSRNEMLWRRKLAERKKTVG